tara:strand:+ start:142 stop:795 length:654 start_codon:yes stop_codon:yes gene_type:complete
MSLTLSSTQARVVASLVEKSITTPQYYPLTTNALLAACNQKSARNPHLNLTEGEVGGALNQLEELRLVKRDNQGSRAQRWRHQFQHELLLKPPVMAVLAALILRGPQTLAELRAHAAPMDGPDDIPGVLAALEDLADRATPLAGQMPRQMGQSALRYTQLICPETAESTAEDADYSAASHSNQTSSSASSGLTARIEALEARVAELESRLSQNSSGT